jgi:hydroxymethylbilane synthase
VGQGALALETRADNGRVRDLLAGIDHADTSRALAAERAFLSVLDGSCRTPIAGHATISGSTLMLRGLVARPDGGQSCDVTRTGSADDAVSIGREAGEELTRRAGPGFIVRD